MTERNVEPRRSTLATPHVRSRIDELEATPQGAQELAAARLAVEVVSLLQQVMNQTDVSQARLCEVLDLSPGAVSQVVHGDGNVRIATVGRYFRALGYQPRLFLDPVEPTREVVASRATCVAIQNEFEHMVRTVLTSTATFAPTALVDVPIRPELQSAIANRSDFATPTDWTEVSLVPAARRQPVPEQIR